MKTTARMRASLALLGLAAVLPAGASAQGAATLRGVVYACGTSTPVGYAHVRLRGLDSGRAFDIATDATGRFWRVGLSPGRYLITASNDRPFVHFSVASRIARLESDDVVDMRIGTGFARPGTRAPLAARTVASERADFSDVAYTQPSPICDDARVPLAVPASDRYIIR